MKNQFIFWIAILIFSVLVQVRGHNPNRNEEIQETIEEPKKCSSASGFPKSCSEIQFESVSNSSQLQNCVIYPNGPVGDSLEVLCDFETEVDGGGWTIFQKRSSGPRDDFNRTWAEYSNGFGSLDKSFWLGLENIRALTQNGDQELRIQLEDFEGNKRWAKYSNFSISDASDFYRLSISGDARDSTLDDDLNYSSNYNWVLDGQQFSTWDKDNDAWYKNCAATLSGGWWFNFCAAANLNGLYFDQGETVPNSRGIFWYSWKGFSYSLAKTEMKIRTRK